MHAVAPHLQNLEQQNADLRQRLAVEARHSFDQRVERAVPNYREIDRNPRWHRWLLSLDPSGCASAEPAIVGSDANRVISFFRGFLQVDQAYWPSLFARLWTGKVAQQTRLHARPDRTAQHRRGAYAGREAEWARQEAKY
jgi:hypothetical protein